MKLWIKRGRGERGVWGGGGVGFDWAPRTPSESAPADRSIGSGDRWRFLTVALPDLLHKLLECDPPIGKTNKMACLPSEDPDQLGIRTVWSVRWLTKDLSFFLGCKIAGNATCFRSGEEEMKIPGSVADSSSHHSPPKPGSNSGPWNCSRWDMFLKLLALWPMEK